MFAGCTRRQIWRLARWGDIIEVEKGAVLAREDRSNHWFFVVLAGSVKVTHRRRDVATLRRGGHFGEVAVIGFRPQPATVTAVEPTVLFVLGRRQFVSLVAMDQSIQRALFPDSAAEGYRPFVRKMHEEGRGEWDRLKPQFASVKDGAPPPIRPRPQGRRLTWSEAVEALTSRDHGASPHAVPETVVTPAMSRPLAAAIVAAALTVVFGVVALLYHPPLAVVSAARPIDVVKDITITGREIDKPTGRYLLTAVNVGRPTLAGVLISWARGRRVVQVDAPGPDDPDVVSERRVMHQAFLSSHRQAIALAEKSLGVDPRGLTIVIRDRGIGGPSAGLTYALAIIDMLDPVDLADDRVVAATGELRPDGRVAPVGFVRMKVDVARNGGADIFLVPERQTVQAHADGVIVIGVEDLEAAVRALKARR